MSSYYANLDLESYDAQQANYAEQMNAWNAQKTTIEAANEQTQADYEAAHAAWEQTPADSEGNPIAEPVAPTPQPVPAQPVAPSEPTTTYTTRTVTTPEELTTPHGVALVLPGLLVVTSSSGEDRAMNADDFARAYTETSEVTP